MKANGGSGSITPPFFKIVTSCSRDTRLHSWLRHCTTNRKFAGSIPDGVIVIILPLHYCPRVDSASNRNESQEYFLGGKGGRWVGLTTFLHSCGDYLEIWEPQRPGIFKSSESVQGLLYLYFFLPDGGN